MYGAMLAGWASEQLEPCRTFVGILASFGTELGLTFYRGILAEAEDRLGERDAALARLDEAVAKADEGHERYYLSDLHRLRGRVLVGLERGEEARAAYLRAISLGESLGAVMSRLRAAVELRELDPSAVSTEQLRSWRDLVEGGTAVDVIARAEALLAAG